MTEAEWQASVWPCTMLEFLRGRASARQFALFACACCRRVERLIPPARRGHLSMLERWADGAATPLELEESIGRVLIGWDPDEERAIVVREMIADILLAFIDNSNDPPELARVATFRGQDAVRVSGGAVAEERKAQAALLREIVRFPGI